MAISSDQVAYAPAHTSRRTIIEAVLAGSVASLALAGGRAPAGAQGTPAAPQSPRPNDFHLTGDNAEIRYFTGDSSLVGWPMFSYTWAEGEVSTEGDGIEVTPLITGGWSFGQLISMYVDAAPDAWARSITLVLPDINLVDGGETAFTTFAVLTTHFTNIGGPKFVQGQFQEYEIIPLEGIASASKAF